MISLFFWLRKLALSHSLSVGYRVNIKAPDFFINFVSLVSLNTFIVERADLGAKEIVDYVASAVEEMVSASATEKK
jgi:hypothetical protein